MAHAIKVNLGKEQRAHVLARPNFILLLLLSPGSSVAAAEVLLRMVARTVRSTPASPTGFQHSFWGLFFFLDVLLKWWCVVVVFRWFSISNFERKKKGSRPVFRRHLRTLKTPSPNRA
jgi:hypothetical protein